MTSNYVPPTAKDGSTSKTNETPVNEIPVIVNKESTQNNANAAVVINDESTSNDKDLALDASDKLPSILEDIIQSVVEHIQGVIRTGVEAYHGWENVERELHVLQQEQEAQQSELHRLRTADEQNRQTISVRNKLPLSVLSRLTLTGTTTLPLANILFFRTSFPLSRPPVPRPRLTLVKQSLKLNSVVS